MSVRRLPVEPPTSTLNVYWQAFVDLLADAHAELDEQAYAAFIRLACDRVGHLAAQLILAEILRAARDQRDAA